MSSENGSLRGSDEELNSTEHQTAFVFTAGNRTERSPRTVKRRKIAKFRASAQTQPVGTRAFSFYPLLNGKEDHESAKMREDLFIRAWSETEHRIQSVLDDANEGTLIQVDSFVRSSAEMKASSTLPAGFIATGPNISSQTLLFGQLLTRLKNQSDGLSVLLRSGDALNLKNALKQIIRDSIEPQDNLNEEETNAKDPFGRKSLNYDLEILYTYVKAHTSSRVVIIIQDSEAFDSELLAGLIELFHSWADRIPFVLLFGIATSLTLFHERLPRSATRCLSGTQFDVESTNNIVDKIFKKTVANAHAPLRLGANLLSSLIARQKTHVQSVQTFTNALKYSYMCHFYGNALSILSNVEQSVPLLTVDHLASIRMLPSYRYLMKGHLDAQHFLMIRELLEDDDKLITTVETHLVSAKQEALNILRVLYILSEVLPRPVQIIDLYSTAFDGTLETSDAVLNFVDSVKRRAPVDILELLSQIRGLIETGCPEMDLDAWPREATEFLGELAMQSSEITILMRESERAGEPLRSSHAIHSKGLRTKVVAQRVQLSYEKSGLSKQDQAFTVIVDELCKTIKHFFACANPTKLFLNEIWLYDCMTPCEEIFTPRPRHAAESALTIPHNYLQCVCCKPAEGISATQPTTASLYQMYLQAGSLINIADIWATFLDNQNQNDEDDFDERKALVMFYESLVDMKQLGLVKQSKKKVDHLAKVLWNGL